MRDPDVTSPASATDTDAIDELLGFHKTIREHLGALLSFSEDAEPPSVNDLKREAHFFSVDIALHDLDEEASLLPRLRQCEHPERLDKMINACTGAHERLETALDQATPYLLALSDGSAKFDREKMRDIHDMLAKVLEPHLRMEELEIMPMARLLLTPEAIHEIRVEMHGRRRSRDEQRPRAVKLA